MFLNSISNGTCNSIADTFLSSERVGLVVFFAILEIVVPGALALIEKEISLALLDFLRRDKDKLTGSSRFSLSAM